MPGHASPGTSTALETTGGPRRARTLDVMSYAPLATRPVFCTREGGHFRLSFPYSASLVERG